MVATRGDDWELAPSLVQLVEEVDAAWPNRRKTSDGSIGDRAHAARKSDHNPDDDGDPMPRGTVSAVDITKLPGDGTNVLIAALIRDPRVWYVIHDGKTWSRTYGFKPRKYTGSNPHTDHVHVSLNQNLAATKANSWGLCRPAEPEPDGPPADGRVLPVLSRGDRHELVETAQRFLGVTPLGTYFGPRTDRAVRRYQRAQGLQADGVVGPDTWARMLRALKLPGWRAK